MESTDQTIEHFRPVCLQLQGRQFLSPREIININKAIVALLKTNSFSLQRSRQSITSVYTDVNRKGSPHLQTQVNQSQMRIELVKVQMRTLARQIPQFEFLRFGIRSDFERPARCDALEDRDQAFGHFVVSRNVQCQRLLPRIAARQEDHRSLLLLSQRLGCHFDFVRSCLAPVREVLQQNPHCPQIGPHPANARQPANRPSKPHAIKSRQCFLDFRSHSLEK
jgi:hypothetical protein